MGRTGPENGRLGSRTWHCKEYSLLTLLQGKHTKMREEKAESVQLEGCNSPIHTFQRISSPAHPPPDSQTACVITSAGLLATARQLSRAQAGRKVFCRGKVSRAWPRVPQNRGDAWGHRGPAEAAPGLAVLYGFLFLCDSTAHSYRDWSRGARWGRPAEGLD